MAKFFWIGSKIIKIRGLGVIFLNVVLSFLCFYVFHKMNALEIGHTTEQENFITNTFFEPGGIGNQVWRLASLYGTGKILRRRIYIESRVFKHDFGNIKWKKMNLNEIEYIFPSMYDTLNILNPPEHLTKKISFAEDCCKYEEPKKLLNISEPYLKISGDYLQSYKFFHSYKNEIRNLLQCGPSIMESVNQIADKMFKNDRNHKLCVHIRRGDFLNDVMLESKEEFVIPAIKFVHKNFNEKMLKEISLVIIGNDVNFANDLRQYYTEFKNVYISQNNNRGEDLCLGINFCDSVILTASGSTFGWWIAYLMKSNGPVFYNSQVTDYGNHSKDIHRNDIFLPEWNRI